MMIISKNISIGFAVSILFLISCDCWTNAEGIVVDNSAIRPLDSVVVKSYINEVYNGLPSREMITDSTGHYFGSTGNTGFCKDLVIEFSKKGYKTLIVKNPNNDTIKMLKN